MSVGYIHLNPHVVTMASHPITTMPLSQSYHHWYLHLFMFSNFSIWHTWYTSRIVIATIFPYLPPSIYPWWFACYIWFTFRFVCISACVHAHVEVNAAWKQLVHHNGLLVFMKYLKRFYPFVMWINFNYHHATKKHCINACVPARVEINATQKQLVQHIGLLMCMRYLKDSILLSICQVNKF